MKHKYFKNALWLFLLLVGLNRVNAQCDINNYSLTPISGTCAQDGKLSVAIDGATSCNNSNTVSASIMAAGSTETIDFITLSTAGTGTFNNLAPGDYQVELFQEGNSVLSPATTVTSTYTPISINLTSKNLTCSTGDDHFTENGEITASFSGGNGPFTIRLTGPNGTEDVTAATSPVSHTFTGLAEGDYSITVIDNSTTCNSSETRSVSLTQTSYPEMRKVNFRRLVNPDCTYYASISLTGGNLEAMKQAGNATYTIAGDPTVYNLTYKSEGIYRFNTGVLPANTDITWTVTDGCNTLSETVNTLGVVDGFTYNHKIASDATTCTDAYEINFDFFGVTGGDNVYFNSSEGATVNFYKEVPADSNNWELVDQSNTPRLYYSASRIVMQGDDITTRYKLEVVDRNNCWTTEEIVDARNAKRNNALDLTELREVNGILEGTSGFRVAYKNQINGLWPTSQIFVAPITIAIERTDGQNSMTINPTMPTDFADSYTINFPYSVQVTTDDWIFKTPVISDLPLGEYRVTLTDNCGYSVVHTIDLKNGATYNPTPITVEEGCASSNIVYDMIQANLANEAQVQLYTNNNGTVGSLVRGVDENPDNTLQGQFSTIPPGEYFLAFKKVRFLEKFNGTSAYNATTSFSVSRQLRQIDFTYYEPITVEDYSATTFSTVSLFCNTDDNNSGILGVTLSGKPLSFINYQIWNGTANPDTDTPLSEYSTTDLTETSYVFTGLAGGDYIVRVSTQCGYTQQTVTLENGVVSYPPSNVNPDTVCGVDTTTTLAVGLPETMFDITWRDGSGTIISNKRMVEVAPTATETFTVEYKLKDAIGCTGAPVYTDEATVIVVPAYKASTNTTATASSIGISTLNREINNGATQWPRNINSAYLVLDSKQKGLVITNLTSNQIENIDAQEGMIVFDTDAQCLKLYNGTEWICAQQTCIVE